MQNPFRAFTLIELLLALAISAVLLALAIPAYQDYVAHAERNRAEVALLQLSAKLEAYFTANQTYAGATLDNLNADALMDGLPYVLNIDSETDADFTISATPQNAQVTRDATCGTLSLNSANVKSISGDGDVTQCWG